MNRHALTAALVAGLVLLAGCSSGLTGSPDGTATGESALTGEATAETIEGETGTLNMYISDQQNAISDFEHLNVTITRVGVKRAGAVDDGEDAEDEGDDTETADTEAADGTETAVNATAANGTETPEPEDESDAADGSGDADDGSDDADDGTEGDGEWIEYAVDNRTVDLTELQGANATRLSSLAVPNGTYEKVFVYVSEINGTLTDGSDQRVKLPSGKLQLNSRFTVGNGEEVDFVFDITVVRAGNSGKYILTPVVSESGTDVEIKEVDDRDEDGDDGDDERDDDRENALNATFDGTVAPGENATLRVTSDGDPVEGASVFVDGERAGTTDGDGTYVIRVPADAEEIGVEVTYRDSEVELEAEFEAGDDESDGTEEPDETAAANESQPRLTVG